MLFYLNLLVQICVQIDYNLDIHLSNKIEPINLNKKPMGTPLERAMALEKQMNAESLQLREVQMRKKIVDQEKNRLLTLLSEAEEKLGSIHDLRATPQETCVSVALFAIQDVFVIKIKEIETLQEKAKNQLLKLLDEEKNLEEQLKIDSAKLDRLYDAVCPNAVGL